MMTFLLTLGMGMAAGSLLTMMPKAHKEAEERYFDELENGSPVYEGLEKYRVKHDQ